MVVSRTKTVTKYDAVKNLKVTKERHKALSQIALDNDATLLEVVDEVIGVGLGTIEAANNHHPAASN